MRLPLSVEAGALQTVQKSLPPGGRGQGGFPPAASESLQAASASLLPPEEGHLGSFSAAGTPMGGLSPSAVSSWLQQLPEPGARHEAEVLVTESSRS